jgi:4-amino-4-deoxy-L-arabinose transferase-like glycosyltransferase
VLSVLPLHTEHSHYVTPDIIVTFFTVLTLLFAALVFRTGQRKWYLWAGVAAGCTLGSKYNVGIVLAVVVLAHFLAVRERRGKLVWLMSSVGLAGLVFFITTPFALFDLPGFLNELAFQVRHYTILGHGSASEAPSWSAYLQDFWLEGFVFQASAVAVGGVVFALFRQRRADWLTVSFPLLAYFFFASAKVHFSRNLLPLLPSLAVLSGVLLVAVAGWLVGRWSGFKTKQRRFVGQSGLVLILFAGFFFFAGLHAVLTDRFFAQPDTRQLAAQWIVADVPAGSKIRLEQGGPILPAERYPNANEQRPIGAHDAAWYRDQGFKYLVANSDQYEELSQTDPTAAANYQQVFSQFTLLKEFKESSKEYPGPTIRIYKVK